MTSLSGISMYKMVPEPKLPTVTIHLNINGTDIFKPVQAAAVSVKTFPVCFIISPVAITKVYWLVTFFNFLSFAYQMFWKP